MRPHWGWICWFLACVVLVIATGLNNENSLVAVLYATGVFLLLTALFKLLAKLES